jgi:pimeloyl-ACP methyl ester carboxylesterase
MIHGISTSCQTLGPLAHELVNRFGCRVMLFDLFGRGFSDTPSDLPHDARLYTTQALLALASSPLAWTGSAARLRVVGYSMGGGVAIHLANTLPDLVDSLVLLAPAGVIRPEKFGVISRLIFTAGLVPERVLAELTRRRLAKPIAAAVKRRTSGTSTPIPPATPSAADVKIDEATHLLHAHRDPIDAAIAEASSSDPSPPLEQRVLRYVQWMVTHHPGFVPAFMSCIRHAPLLGQEEAFAGLASRRPGSTAIILGRTDEIVDPDEYEVDALPLVGGKDAVFWRVISGSHDFPMTHTADMIAQIDEFWRQDGATTSS